MDVNQLNWLAILACTLLTFVTGGLWYAGPLFGKAWMKENGFSEEDLKKGNMAKIFLGSFFLGFIATLNLAIFLGPQTDASMGAFYGFLAGFGWVATAIGVLYLFERKSFRLFLINAGYHVVVLTLNGLILGMWK